MKRHALAVFVSAVAAQAGAAPENLPPPGFTASSFVDAAGCVYARADLGGQTVWAQQLDAIGQPMCGQAPTVIVEGGSDALPAIAPTARNRAPLFAQPGTYLQVGAFGLTANADRVTAGLQAEGLSVLRQDFPRTRGQLRVLFVGPFEGPEAVDQALATVRSQGFRDAFAWVQAPVTPEAAN